MSNENDTENLSDEELKELAEAEASQTKAAPVEKDVPEPQPDAVEPASQTPAPEPNEPPVTPSPSPEPVNDGRQDRDKDPMDRLRRKGLDTPEAIARSYMQMEEEFHRRNQAGHPGYRDLNNGNPAPAPVPPPNWSPNPQIPQGYPQGNGYQQPPASRRDVSQRLAEKYGMDPDDVERLMPMVVDAAESIAARRTNELQVQLFEIRRQSARTSEFQTLMQDPAFTDPRVQAEMQNVLKDGSLYQRSATPHATAFNIALANLARKQLQQGTMNGNASPTNMPPATAGGGNGSANTAPYRITEKEVEKWSDDQFKTFLDSNGRVVPRR